MIEESPSGLSINIPNTERFDYLEPEGLLRKVDEIKQQGGVIDTITIGENVIEAYEKNQLLENYNLIGYPRRTTCPRTNCYHFIHWSVCYAKL